jgi:signal transduction histidine kinase
VRIAALTPDIPPHHRGIKRRVPRVKRLVLLSVFTMLCVIAITLAQAYREYNLSYRRGESEAARLTAIVSDHVEQSIQTVDLTLQHALERQHLNQLFGGTLPEDLINNFKLWVNSIPQIVAMVMVNDQGKAEIAVNNKDYANWIDYKTSFKDFLPFLLLEHDESEANVIMPYVANSYPHQQITLVSRRLSKLNGRFGGIVSVAMRPEFFLNFFASVDTGKERFMDVFTDNGESLFEEMNHTRRWQSDARLWERVSEMKRISEDGVLTYQHEGRIMVIAYRSLESLPLTAIVAIDETDFLADFWRDRFKDMSFLLIFTVFGSVVSYFVITMAKQVVRIEESESTAILASQAKSEFLANMSHELRTPLNAIIGFSEMMTAGYFGPLNAKQRERIGDISMCGNHLLQLINDILEFSKGEAGRMELVEEKVSIPTLIDETMRIMNEKVKSKGVLVSIDARDTLPLLFADKRKLKQVLINLVSNAVKFTPPEGTIFITAQLDPHRNMMISVRDTGIGIAEEDIPTALAVFGQVHRSQSHEGTGLGLPLCRMFTELHGGKMVLTSILGEGTTVKLHFPAVRIVEVEE